MGHANFTLTAVLGDDSGDVTTARPKSDEVVRSEEEPLGLRAPQGTATASASGFGFIPLLARLLLLAGAALSLSARRGRRS